MKKLMAIFAHPDDEGSIAGTLIRYAEAGVETILVCATRGEEGEISDPALSTQENLGQVRQGELEEACKILGVQHLEFLDYRDSGMKGTPANQDPRSLLQADPQEVIRKIVRLVRRYQPDIVITFEPFGWYGHPDHQAVSRLTTEAMQLVGDQAAFPADGKAWQPARFFYSAISYSEFREMFNTAVDHGLITGQSFDVTAAEEQQLMETERQITHSLDISASFDSKQTAMQAHKTQFSESHLFVALPKEIRIKALGHEYFIQVVPPPTAELTQNHLNDLFAGV